MSEAASVSNLSNTSSRSEHMAYLMNDLNLDRATAALMYRAERLQEKGQLQQALRYFERVLANHQDCQEAAVNARMIREQLADAPRLEPVQEEARDAEASPKLQTANMPLTVIRQDSEKWDVYWTESELRDAVLGEANRKLQKVGIVTPFLEIVSMDIETYTPSVHDDPWMDTRYTCRAVVRATFPPQMVVGASSHASNEQPAAAAAEALLARLAGAGAATQATAPRAAGEPDQEPSVCESGKNRTAPAGSAPSQPPEPAPPQTCAAAAAAAGESESVRSSGSRHSSVHS